MRYRPVNVLPAEWDRVKEFCRQAVFAYEPPTVRLAGELMSTVTLFVLWATQEEHAPLDSDGLFHPALMGRYLRSRVSDKKSGSFRTLRSRLFRVGSANTSVDHNKTKRDTRHVPVREYTAGELAELEGWAATQNSDERRRYAYTTLALMGGAGLRMSEALGVRGADISRDVDGYTVRILGPRARTIPINVDWQHYLDEPSTHFIDDEHVLYNGQTERGRATTLRMLYRGPHPAPNPQWLHDTWLLQILRILPLSIVMQSVGTSDVVRFRRYFDGAHLEFDQWHDAVRNPAAYGAGMGETCGIDADDDSPLRAAHAEAREDIPSAAGSRPVDEEGHEPRPIESLGNETRPEKPRRKSRYESLPPGGADLPATFGDCPADRKPADKAGSEFEVLRAALLADALRSARGGKR